MTEEEILKLSDEELVRLASKLSGRVGELQREIDRVMNETGGLLGFPVYIHWDPVHDIDAAMDLFYEIYNPLSKIRGGAWVLGTVNDGKDCSLATLFWKKKLTSRQRPLKVQAKAKKKQMAKAITLCYVMAMEGATDDLRYQPEEAWWEKRAFP